MKHTVRKRKRPAPRVQNDSSSSAEEDSSERGEGGRLLETTEDSALDTPAEEGFLSSTPSHHSGVASQEGKRHHKKPELAAVKLAKYMGKDLRDMFSGMQLAPIRPGNAASLMGKDKTLVDGVNAMAITAPVL